MGRGQLPNERSGFIGRESTHPVQMQDSTHDGGDIADESGNDFETRSRPCGSGVCGGAAGTFTLAHGPAGNNSTTVIPS